MQRSSYAKGFLIAAFVLVFGWFGIDKFLHPLTWIGWIPAGFEDLGGLTRNTWLQVFGVIEIVLAAALLFPIRRIRQLAALGIIGHLIGVLTQVGFNDIGVRDMGLLLSAVALLLLL